MAFFKETVIACATFAGAMGIGVVVQSTAGSSERSEVMTALNAATSGEDVHFVNGPVLEISEVILTSALDSAPLVPNDGPEISSDSDERIQVQNVTDYVSCPIAFTATPAPVGMVSLDLSAPCAKAARINLHHNGMITTQLMDADGRLQLTHPALSADAVFFVAFSDGKGVMAEAYVPAVEEVDRLSLQWRQPAGFEMHAREFGASYGAEGHRWAGRPGGFDVTSLGAQGFLVRLGDQAGEQARQADVYTFPRAATAREGDVNLTIEAEVTVDNCGRDIAVEVISSRMGRAIARDLSLQMPDCEAVGSFLILTDILSPVRVASN